MLRIVGETHPLSILILKRKGLFQLDFYNKTQRVSKNLKSPTCVTSIIKKATAISGNRFLAGFLIFYEHPNVEFKALYVGVPLEYSIVRDISLLSDVQSCSLYSSEENAIFRRLAVCVCFRRG